MVSYSLIDLARTWLLVDFTQFSMTLSLLSIIFIPVAWTTVARNEYRNKTLTRMFRGNARYGCYFFAAIIFSAGLARDALYHRALADQPRRAMLPTPLDTLVPAALFLLGQTLVVTSTWALGITGTFHGDYFGIFMDHRAEGSPFKVLRDRMYKGSTLSFAAAALWYERPAGFLISLHVYGVYLIALRFEEPFTDVIYAGRAESQRSR
ncbi:phospholipid methyltransferase-domain-containing protein [Mycena maculata]|uniref:Phosphatidyl-N-methylethanolamine N-methyltransferase n=1 Tax=Mycena maculata TaxID=230809 RepID=A0AAD7I1D7_9AGAR|nr:phospholipid methyltransferase-domain-containing protein [Mycena maculata]